MIVLTDNGNGALKYPIALITIDEVSFAGGVYMDHNELYYLKTESTYWTMSPHDFSTNISGSNVWCVAETGNVGSFATVATAYGVRPVINLSSSVQYVSGVGTESDPYVISLT